MEFALKQLVLRTDCEGAMGFALEHSVLGIDCVGAMGFALMQSILEAACGSAMGFAFEQWRSPVPTVGLRWDSQRSSRHWGRVWRCDGIRIAAIGLSYRVWYCDGIRSKALGHPTPNSRGIGCAWRHCTVNSV